MTQKAQLKFRKGGSVVEADIGIHSYKEASAAGKSLFAHLNSKHSDDVDHFATAMDQVLAQAGFDAAVGVRDAKERRKALGSYNFGDAMHGNLGAAITREDTPASRLLAPAVVLELIEDQRVDDKTSEIAIFRQQVAGTRTIAGSRYEQPKLNLDIPATADYSRSSQLALPNIMGTLTVSKAGGSIPSFALGLEISDQAQKAFSFDQVAMVLNRQRMMHEVRALEVNMHCLVNGDIDLGQDALPVVNASAYDPTAITPETFSQKALRKILRQDRLVRQPTHIWGDEEAYDAYIKRLGRPKASDIFVEDPESGAKIARPINMNIVEPEFWVLDEGVIPAGHLAFLDKRYAIEEYVNSEANYEATEQLVMRRAMQMRFDYGRVMRRLDDSAWLVVNMTA